MTDTQEAMREFEKSRARHFGAFCMLTDRKDCSQETAFNFAYQAAWQAATAQSAEKIARLEAEVADADRYAESRYYEGHAAGRQENINERLHGEKISAAAELSNKQLRDEFSKLLHHCTRSPSTIVDAWACKDAHEALAQQPSTEALAGYVAKEKAELQEFAIWLTGCGYDFTQHDYFMNNRHLLHRYLPPAPEKE